MSDAYAEELAQMAVALHQEPDVEHTLDRVLEYSMQAVGCTHAGVMLVHADGGIETAASSDQVVDKADELQLEYNEGPCVSAIENAEGYLVGDLATDARWPKWGPRVTKLGMRSMVSVRLRTRGSTIGSLNLYASTPDNFDRDDLAVADVFARHASVALDSSLQDQLLRQAVDTRNLIGQAQGILMERFDLDPHQAFALLREYSRRHDIKLSEAARRLVSGHDDA